MKARVQKQSRKVVFHERNYFSQPKFRHDIWATTKRRRRSSQVSVRRGWIILTCKVFLLLAYGSLVLTFVPLRYLIHAPYGGKEARNGTWRALVEAQQDGKIRSLGVSNYGVHHLDELESYIKELEAENGQGKGGKISVGQWELHPWLTRPDIVEWCTKRGIILEAYCPIVRGQRSNEPILQPLAKRYNKTPEQILLRWSLQKVLKIRRLFR